MPQTLPRRLLKMKAVKQVLPLSTGTLYTLVSTRQLESVRVGKTIMVYEDALEAFIAKNTNSAIQD